MVVGQLDPREDEELDESGRIVSAGESSIIASWLASDRESGVSSYLVAVGTQPGSYDVTFGWRNFGTQTSGLLNNLGLNLTDPKTGAPVYYLTVKAQNGAKLESVSLTSKPIVVVKSDVAGVAFDGESESADADYQRHGFAVTTHFNGFESERCGGIAGYTWSIGRQPALSDIQPFTTEGIVMYTNGSGKAQIPLSLSSGDVVYCTVKAETKCGNHLTSTSDGIVIDSRKPTIEFVSDRERYVVAADLVAESWRGNDSDSGINDYRWWAGTAPRFADAVNATTSKNSETPPGIVKSVSSGVPVYFSVSAEDSVGLRSLAFDRGTVVDSTSPLSGSFRCPPAVPSSADSISCCWEMFLDVESLIEKYTLMIGATHGSAIFGGPVSVVSTESCVDIPFGAAKRGDGSFVVTFEAHNKAGLKKSASRFLTVDSSPPVRGTVRFLLDRAIVPFSNFSDVVKCQESESEVHLMWESFVDDQSSVAKYEVGVGTVSGSGDIYPFTSVGSLTATSIRRLFMPHGSTIYASVRAINQAGLSSVATSDGLHISFAPKIVVRDGLAQDDVNYQSSSDTLSASWTIDDSCPSASLSWAIRRIDQHVILPFSQISLLSTSALQDNLALKSGESYYVVVRSRNVVGLAAYGRSDGVLVDTSEPVPGHVYDGPEEGVDIGYQESVTTLAANWKSFGDVSSSLPGQQIELYIVALGTDDGDPLTRQNVVPFTEVGLNRTMLFTSLDLTPNHQYFVTVRATSKTGITAESTSNGIYVGLGEPPLPGRVEAVPFSNNSAILTASWQDFSSELPLLFYEWAISSFRPNTSAIDCPDSVLDYGFDSDRAVNRTVDFDVMPFSRIGLHTIATAKELSLLHNQKYYVTVRATNVALRCISVVSDAILVDLTPPTSIAVPVGYENNLKVSYTTDPTSIFANWSRIVDDESGISSYAVALFKDTTCRKTFDKSLLLVRDYVSVSNSSSYAFTGLDIESNEPHFVKVVAINGAGSRSISSSWPVLLDTSGPHSGNVNDGKNWFRDRVFQSSLDTLSGVISIATQQDDLRCPDRYYNFSDKQSLSDWKYFDPNQLKGVDAYGSYIFDPKQVTATGDGLRIGVVRDRGYKKLRSSCLYTDIVLSDDSSIDITIAAAGGEKLVTSAVLWDGSAGTLGDIELRNPFRDSSQIDVIEIFRGNPFGNSSIEEIPLKAPDQNRSSVNIDAEALFTTSSPSLGFHIFSDALFNDSVFYAALWCRYARDRNSPKISWIELNFDPSVEPHEYSLKFSVRQTEADLDRVADFYVDGELRGILTGIPSLSMQPRFMLGVRTRFGFVPPLINPFDPPATFAFVRNIRMPVAVALPCHYGKPFYDFESHVHSIDVCVGLSPTFSCDVTSFFPVPRPCTPCVHLCDRYDCDENCDMAPISPFAFSLSNLTLDGGSSNSGSGNGHNNEDPIVYYLHLVFRNGAGLSTTASSSGVVVDVTPPACLGVFQVDPSWSLTEPSLFQGTDNAIAAFWECTDDVSTIVAYMWSVRKQNITGDLIVEGSLSESEKVAVARNLSLQHQETYVFILNVKNGAGIQSTWTGAGITIDVKPPNLEKASIGMLNKESLPQLNLSSVDGVTRKSDVLGFSWANLDDDVIGEVGELF